MTGAFDNQGPRFDHPFVRGGISLEQIALNCKRISEIMTPERKTNVTTAPLRVEYPEGSEYLAHLNDITTQDAAGLVEAERSYGNSWKKRGGVSAFMMLCRKWDRIEKRVASHVPLGPPAALVSPEATPYDIFAHIRADPRAEGIIDDIRDLRRYLVLVEAEMVARGAIQVDDHRDNQS